MYIHISRGGEQSGPYSEATARQFLQEGKLLSTDLAWHDGADGWKPLSEVLEAVAQPLTTPPPELSSRNMDCLQNSSILQPSTFRHPKGRQIMFWLVAAVVAPVILYGLNFIINHFNLDSDHLFKQEWANNTKLILMFIVYAGLGMTPVCGIIASIMLFSEIVKENVRISEFCELCRRGTNYICNYNAGLFSEAIGEGKIAEIVGANKGSELFVNAPLITGPVGSHTFVAFDAGFTDRTSNYSYQKNIYTIIAIGSGDNESNWQLYCWQCYMPTGQLLDTLRQF